MRSSISPPATWASAPLTPRWAGWALWCAGTSGIRLIYPTAIGYAASDSADEQQRQREAWTTVQRGHAVANGLPVVAVNRVGFEPDPSGQTPGIEFWGSTFVAGPQGELLYRASADGEERRIVDLDLGHSEQVRRWWPFLRDRRIDEYGDITRRYIDR